MPPRRLCMPQVFGTQWRAGVGLVDIRWAHLGDGRPYLLFVEHRECRCLNAICVRYHKIYCECLAVFGDCAANLAYWPASFFSVNSTVLVSICIPERLSKSGLPIDG